MHDNEELEERQFRFHNPQLLDSSRRGGYRMGNPYRGFQSIVSPHLGQPTF
jgi:hypothetical protein